MILTKVNPTGRSKSKPVWVNIDNVHYVEPCRYRSTHPDQINKENTSAKGTEIWFKGISIVVKETFDEVRKAIEYTREGDTRGNQQ